MVALGYPLPSKTPSLDLNTWYYWKNRVAYYSIEFRDGVVVSSNY